MYSFTPEEAVFVKQLAEVRKQLAVLVIEERTQEDRVLSILRGHGEVTGLAEHDGSAFDLQRKPMDGVDYVVITERSAHEHGMVPAGSMLGT